MIRTARVGRRSARTHVPVIGSRADGSPIYGIAGGAGDDTDDEEEEDDEDEEEDSKSKSGDKSSEDDEEDDEEDEDEKPVTREELQRMERRMRAADRRADRAESENRRLKKQKGKGQQDRDKKDDKKDDAVVEELRTKAQRADELEDDNVALSVQIAVLTTPEVNQFHDPGDILRFLDFDELVDGEGSIDKAAVKDALEDLAERKKHLVKSSAAGDSDDEDEEGKDKKLPKSGRQNNGKKSKSKTLTRAALAAKYPALRQR